MGYKYTSGTIRNFRLGGVSYRVMADANFTEKPSQYENEAVPTSGDAMIKKTKIARVLESVTLGTSVGDRQYLAAVADSNEVTNCSYMDAAGNTHRCPECTINIEGNETESNTTTITVQPVKPWTIAEAS